MITFGAAAEDVIAFLKENGFCPEKAAFNQVGVSVMTEWVKGGFTDADVLRSLENLEALTGKSLKIEG